MLELTVKQITELVHRRVAYALLDLLLKLAEVADANGRIELYRHQLIKHCQMKDVLWDQYYNRLKKLGYIQAVQRGSRSRTTIMQLALPATAQQKSAHNANGNDYGHTQWAAHPGHDLTEK